MSFQNRATRVLVAAGVALCVAPSLAAQDFGYRVLSTAKTSTMQKEMQEAADVGFRFGGVMGGETAAGGSEVVVVMVRDGSAAGGYQYRLLTAQGEHASGGAEDYVIDGRLRLCRQYGCQDH